MAELDQVPGSPEQVCPLLTGSTVPIITLNTPTEERFDFNDAIRKKPAVVVFYRGGW